ncbi:MAG: alpha/beta hydrolase [Pseudomonadales bacterium]
MSHKFIEANGLQIAYDEFGQADHPAIILIMGLGTQMIAWPEEFCMGLVDQGFRVIRFDNRDIGLSEKLENSKTPGLLKLLLLSRLNLKSKVPYRLLDMAHDTVGLMDALDIGAAHVVGASMGGMIAQLVTGHFPERVLSLTSIMSTSGRRGLPSPSAKVTRQLVRRPKGTGEEDYIKHALKTWSMIGSPGFSVDQDVLRERMLEAYRRSYHPMGYKRQAAAIMASGDRTKILKSIRKPTLVIHGKEDVLVPVSGGIDTARLVQGSKLELIDGMGHDLPRPLMSHFAELIGSHARQQGASQRLPS